jgi:hypothetical protein
VLFKRTFGLIFCALALVFTSPAIAGDIYVDPDWSGTESGTEAQPYNTLSEAQTAAVANDRILLKKGTIYYDVLGSGRNWSSSSKNGITITSYGSGANPIVNGVVSVASGSLTNVASDVWSFTVSDAAVVTGVWYNYYGTVKAGSPCIGAYGGALTEIRTATPANDLTSVSSTPNSWAMSATSGAATVRVNIAGTGTTPPADNLIEWGRSVSNGNALVFASSNSIAVSGIDFDRINPRFITTADGAAILIQASTGSTVTNCRFWDCNDKAVGFTGTTNSGNTISDCTFWGTSSQAPDSQLNWFVSGGGTITGARATRCTFYVSGLYTRSHGVLAPRPTTVTGWGSGYTGSLTPISAHVSSVGTDFVTDVELTDCTYEIDSAFWLQSASTGYPSSPNLVYCNGSRAVSSSPWTVSSYPVRFVRLVVRKGMGFYLAADSTVAFDRCTLAMDAGVSGAQYRHNSGARGVWGFNSSATNATMLLSGCDWVSNLNGNSTNTYGLLTFGNNSSLTSNLNLYAVKTTFRDISVPAGDHVTTFQSVVFLVPINAAGTSTTAGRNRMEFAKCAFIRTSADSAGDLGVYPRAFLVYNDFDPAATVLRQQFGFAECLYYGFPTTGTANGGFASNSGGATFNDASEWTSNKTDVGMDNAGVTGTNPSLDSPQTSPTPSAGSALLTGRGGSFETVLGINGRPGNNIGCYQNGQFTAATRATLRRMFLLPL